ncbi:MAG: alpha/beta hydrolase [Cyanobacteria bacterium J06639_14]
MLNNPVKSALNAGLLCLLTLPAVAIVGATAAPAETQNADSSLITSLPTEPIRQQESNGTVVILPPSYDESVTYPALVLLPWTGGTPADYFRGTFVEQYRARTEDPFILILPSIRSSRSDYSSSGAWQATIERYENLVSSNLELLVPKYNIDASRVVVGGHSLGGDLSWALGVRNPDLVHGVIAVGSQSNYRDESKMPQLATSDSRFFMVMGADDWRIERMRLAVNELAKHEVSHSFEVVPNANHRTVMSQYAPGEVLTQGMDYILSGEE